MPVSPPSSTTLVKFDPVYLTDEDLADLSTFTGLGEVECIDRVRSYSMDELAEAWRLADPKTHEDITRFYQSTDLYIWELMQWHASPSRRPYWDALTYLVDHYPAGMGWERVYDFGGGIGTDALFLAAHGYAVTLVDVDGPAFRFARHRFERRGLNATFVESRGALPEPEGRYDVVVCFDVLEHLPEPLEATRRLTRAIRREGLLLQCGGFTDDGCHPCHLQGGLRRFGGARWHVQLAGLGLRNVSGLVYQRAAGLAWFAQKARFSLWRATNVWLAYVDG